MENTPFDLSDYLNLSRLDDAEYVKSKHIILKEKDGFKILKYNRDYLKHWSEDDTLSNIDSLGLFRSVIVKDDKVVSFAPPKSHKLKSWGEPDAKKILCEEYVEGTMINVFYDTKDWQIASRSLIGANGQFYKGGKTFRRMFLEAMNNCELKFDDLNMNYCYSFVFQHPENRIVGKCKEPKLYLCAVYNVCDGTASTITEVNFRENEDLCSKVNVPDVYSSPEYDFNTWSEIWDKFANTDTNPTPYDIMGVVIKDGMGARTKIRNPNYEFVRELRGNQPKNQFQYYNLRREGRVHDYLRFYPEQNEEFAIYREQLHTYTQTLHDFYIRCYIKKEKPLGEFPYEYRSHMYTLHQKYLDELRCMGQCVRIQEVMTYINTLEPARLMYTINYKLREQNVDDKKDALKDLQIEDTNQGNIM